MEEAMEKSGYTCRGLSARNTGVKLEKNAYIRERIEEERLTIFDKSMITEEYVLNNLRDLAENARYESDRIRANELLGKYLAMFTDKVKSEGSLLITKEDEREVQDIVTRMGVENQTVLQN